MAGQQQRVPVVLSVAGLDPSSGAGMTADLKVFAAHGLYGAGCVTAITVQSTQGVRRSAGVEVALVEETLACLGEDLEIAGVKVGMLGTGAVASAVAGWLEGWRAREPGGPLVVDPVLQSSSGHALLDADGLKVLRDVLLPMATVVTPNLPELARLLGAQAGTAHESSVLASTEQAARQLLQSMGARAGQAVVVTGGHRRLDDTPDDYLVQAGAAKPQADGVWLPGEWVRTQATHGTGCAYAAALLCGLVQRRSMLEACVGAKKYVAEALRRAYPVGRGKGPMHHLFALDGLKNRPKEDGTT